MSCQNNISYPDENDDVDVNRDSHRIPDQLLGAMSRRRGATGVLWTPSLTPLFRLSIPALLIGTDGFLYGAPDA